MSLLFLQPESLTQAQELVAQYGDDAKIIAGGTAIVLMMQQKLIATEVLISLEKVSNVDYVKRGRGGLHFGPMARLRDLALSPLVEEQFPALASACGQVGNVRIQNQATLGGNLAEADYASDPPAVLLALDASVEIAGPRGTRQVSLADFFLGFYTTILEPDELITNIFVPVLPSGSRMTYLKFKSRSSEDRPCVGVAAVGSFDGDVCTDLRLSVGAACEVPHRLADHEALAAGKVLDNALAAAVADGYATDLDTLDDLRGSAWYRTEMVRVHVRRALAQISRGGE